MPELTKEQLLLSKATALEMTAAKVRRLSMKPWTEAVGTNVGRCSQLVFEMLAIVMEEEDLTLSEERTVEDAT